LNNKKSYRRVIETLRNLLIKARYHEALKVYLQNVGEFNDMPELRNIGGDVLNRLNKKEEAILEYERCIELYRAKKLYANAIAIAKKILRIGSHYEHIYAVLGDVYLEAGLVGEAIQNYLEYAERMRKSTGHAHLKETFGRITELFGEENKVLLQTLSGYPELKKEFDNFRRERKSLKGTQKEDLLEMIKRDPEYGTFSKLVEVELLRSRRYMRQFSIFTIETSLFETQSENRLIDMEKMFGIVKNNLRTIDYLFLNSNDFFYGLLPETPSDGVFILSDRLANKLKELYQIKVSMRWVTYPKDGQKIETLLTSLQKSGHVYFK